MSLLDRLGMTVPIIQAPMAGVSTPDMAAAVSNAGGLGSISVGATDADGARSAIEATRSKTNKAFNVNVFVHPEANADPDREAAWLAALDPLFRRFDAKPPDQLRTIYKSFAEDDEMLAALVEHAPAVVSLHFGLPAQDKIDALKACGSVLLATVTNLDEAKEAEAAGIDALVAQGIEAGGHRGMFNPDASDEGLGTFALTRLLASKSSLPVIAAGGIMDGAGIRAALDLGAVAAQLGTAFVACPESTADQGFRAALADAAETGTAMTSAISGRPARGLVNKFVKWGEGDLPPLPDYPIAYDAGKALNAAAKAAGEAGFSAQWAGQGAPLSRALPAAQLVSVLNDELIAASQPNA
ncbi:MAG: nitronate monooxygenase [Pseudomonadota bacterium]